MTVQIRTPYRDDTTGLTVFNRGAIFKHYMKTWFLVDLFSVIPFETLRFDSADDDAAKLSLLRFFRLARLLKLLRVFRANKKLQRLRIYAKVRHATLSLWMVR
jgi:hypothetical protein